MLKSAVTAPDLVPVAIQGAVASADQAKAAVRGISLRRTMTEVDVRQGEEEEVRGMKLLNHAAIEVEARPRGQTQCKQTAVL